MYSVSKCNLDGFYEFQFVKDDPDVLARIFRQMAPSDRRLYKVSDTFSSQLGDDWLKNYLQVKFIEMD